MLIETYRDYDITLESFGYCVLFCGDEVILNSIEEARNFIDSIQED